MFLQIIIKDNIYIPELIYLYILNSIQYKENRLYKYLYKDLFNLTFNDEYLYVLILRKKLALLILNGAIYVLISLYDYNLYMKLLNSVISYDKALEIYNEIKNILGLTKYNCYNIYDGTTKNCIIIINKSSLLLNDWINTLLHLLTHFIQRTIGLEKTLNKKYQKKIDKNIEHPDIIKFALKITKNIKETKEFKESLINKITYMLAKNLLQLTLKSLFLMFKNMYLRDLLFLNGLIKNINIKDNYLSAYLWLNLFLLEINSSKYLLSIEFKKAILLWKSKKFLKKPLQLIKHRYISYILCYFAIKNVLPQLNIDNKLKLYFKSLNI